MHVIMQSEWSGGRDRGGGGALATSDTDGFFVPLYLFVCKLQAACSYCRETHDCTGIVSFTNVLKCPSGPLFSFSTTHLPSNVAGRCCF